MIAGHLAGYTDSSHHCRISFRAWLGTIEPAIPIPLPLDLSSAPTEEHIRTVVPGKDNSPNPCSK